ncbi:MAG TPA: rhodanese-like domain-containing protein [Clostridia bacterium]
MSMYYKRYDIMKVDINDINKLITNNDYLIDLRSVGEYKDGHLPNSINVPFLQIGDWINKI